jgi:hypothetical protein
VTVELRRNFRITYDVVVEYRYYKKWRKDFSNDLFD